MSQTVRVAAVGDLMPGDSAICTGFGFASRMRDVPLDRVLAEVAPLLREADIALGNLEVSVSAIGASRGSWARRQMRGVPRHAAELRSAGFHVLNVANNHAVQHGLAAFEDTVAIVRAAGIDVCGLRGDDGWSSRPVIRDVRGTKVGILGYSFRPRQYSNDPPPYAEGDEVAVLRDVARLRTTTDHVIVSLHWGEEFVTRPSESEVGFASRVIDAGALLVTGHHPHVLRAAERRGSGVVAYSLGNLVSDMTWLEPLRHGGVLVAELAGDRVAAARLHPTRIDDQLVPRIGTARVVEAAAEEGMPAAEYAAAVARTVGQQRSASYRYALSSLHRFPPQILLQLGAVTIRNKLGAMLHRRPARNA